MSATRNRIADEFSRSSIRHRKDDKLSQDRAMVMGILEVLVQEVERLERRVAKLEGTSSTS